MLKGFPASQAVQYPHPELRPGGVAVLPREAELVVKDALADADALRKLARSEVEEARRVAREQGYADGFAQAQEAVVREFARERAELASLRERVEHDAASLEQLLQVERSRVRTEALAQAQREMVQLAMAAATKVVRTELSSRQDLVVQLIAQAVAATAGEGAAQVRAAAADVDWLHARRSELASAGTRVAVEPDPTLELGEFVVQGPTGIVDGRVAAQIGQLEQAALGAVAELGGHER